MTMIKRTGSVLLALSLIMGSISIGFSETVDLQYAEMLKQKMSTMEPTEKAKYEEMLQIALFNNDTIDATIKNINNQLTDKEKAALAAQGITNSYIVNSLQALKTWSQDDRFALVAAAKSNNLDAVVSLNTKNVAPSSGGSTGGSGSTGSTGGSGSTGGTTGGSGGTGDAGSGGSTPPPAGSGAVTTPVTPTTPVIPTTPTTPVTPVTPTTPKETVKKPVITDDALDKLLESAEFKELLQLDSEETAKGSIAVVANDSVVHMMRQAIAKTEFKLPEEIKNVTSTIKIPDIGSSWAKSGIQFLAAKGALSSTEKFEPKTKADKLDVVTILVNLFGDSKEVKATKLVTLTDVKTNKADQLAVAFAIENKIVTKDSKGNIGASKAVTRRDVAELISKTFKAMKVEMATDSKKLTLLKDIKALKAADQALMNQMQLAGIITPDKSGNVKPSQTVTKEELAAMLKRAYDYYLKQYGL